MQFFTVLLWLVIPDVLSESVSPQVVNIKYDKLVVPNNQWVTGLDKVELDQEWYTKIVWKRPVYRNSGLMLSYTITKSTNPYELISEYSVPFCQDTQDISEANYILELVRVLFGHPQMCPIDAKTYYTPGAAFLQERKVPFNFKPQWFEFVPIFPGSSKYLYYTIKVNVTQSSETLLRGSILLYHLYPM